MNYEEIAEQQKKCEELKALLSSADTSLQWKKIKFNGQHSLMCDVSTNNVRPFIPAASRRAVISKLHGIAHNGIKATAQLVRERFVWLSIAIAIAKDVKTTVRQCVSNALPESDNIQQNENVNNENVASSPKRTRCGRRIRLPVRFADEVVRYEY